MTAVVSADAVLVVVVVVGREGRGLGRQRGVVVEAGSAWW
jgi:hypothetical protein